ncbi:MAG TPA: response regulator [Methylobacterium sp.]|jgi:CheY-like chemotaxis protein
MIATILLLLVDDDAGVRLILEEALKDGGYEVASAKDGAEALAVLQSRSADLRGVITDVDLGRGPDGWDVARHARELSPDIPVVYMSGASAHAWSAQGVPNSTIIQKPFAGAQVVTAISALINVSDARH